MEEWTNCFVVRISGHSAQFAQRRTIPNAILQKPLYSTFSTVIFRYVLKHLIHLHLSEMNIRCDKFQITLRFTKQSVMLLVALTSCQQLSKWISVCFQTNDDLFWLQIGVCGDVTSHSLVPTVFIEVFMHAGKFHRKSLPFFFCVWWGLIFIQFLRNIRNVFRTLCVLQNSSRLASETDFLVI